MRGENHPKRAALASQREETMGALSDAFAQDKLTLAELEERMATAQECGSVAELLALTQDLALPAVRVAVPEAVQAPAATGAALATRSTPVQAAVAVLGAVERRLSGPLDRDLRVTAFLGAVELDLSEAQLPVGVTELHVTATLGAVELKVPDDVVVECQGAAFLGAFEDASRRPDGGGEVVLRIRGRAILGSVEVRRARAPRRLPRGH